MRYAKGSLLFALTFCFAGISPVWSQAPKPAAQGFPSKTIRMILPLAAGGPTDILARLVAQPLSAALGQQVVVDNRPGAAGNIAAEMAAKSPADGYTLFMAGSGNFAINVSLFSKLPYDPVRDFAPVILMASAPFVVATHPSLPVKTFNDLVKLAKARPGQLNYGAVTGNAAHLATELLNSLAGIKMVHVPYKGAVLATTDLIAGHIQVSLSSTPGSIPFVQTGKLRALAVTSAKRITPLPDLPTVAESGLKGYEASTWYAIVGPAGMPRPIVDRLYSEIEKIVNQPATKEKMIANHFEPTLMGPDQFGAYMKAEIDKWAKVVRSSGTKIE
jgi:tripartite-type tricarboxylate transporter receptor subunit TctC